MQEEVGNTMPDINFFWLGYYENGMQIRGNESIKNIPNLEDIKLLEVYINNKDGDVIYHLGVGLRTGFFYINDVQIDPAPLVLEREPKPVLRPIFFLVRDKKMTLFSDGSREVSKEFTTVGIRVGWQTTIEVEISEKHSNGLKNIQKMMVWKDGWSRIAITDKR